MTATKDKKAPKSIATINFKGGVGKTTCTWCLGEPTARVVWQSPRAGAP